MLTDYRRDKERCIECGDVLTVKEKETNVNKCDDCAFYEALEARLNEDYD